MMTPFIKRALKTKYSKKDVKTIVGNAKTEYRKLLNKADDIGSKNLMASNLYMCLLFFSFMQGSNGKISTEDLKDIMRITLSDPILLKLMGNKDFNDPKELNKFKEHIHKNSDWAELHRKEYPETWKFNFDDSHQDGFYYYFTKCPIAKFFKDNNLEEITPIFCELDHLTIKTRKAKLLRDKTLANGDDMCDFWIVGDKVKDPK
jgi:hypothetical protein